MVKTRINITCKIVIKAILLFITLPLLQCADTTTSTEYNMGDLGKDMKAIDFGDTKGAGANPKMSSLLNQLLEVYQKGGVGEAEAFAKKRLIVIDKACAQVSIITTEEAIGNVRAAVEQVGGKYQLHFKNRLQMLVPIGELEDLAHRSEILMIREPRRAIIE
jgi:hypothetical protein